MVLAAAESEIEIEEVHHLAPQHPVDDVADGASEHEGKAGAGEPVAPGSRELPGDERDDEGDGESDDEGPAEYLWLKELPLIVRAMTLSGDVLWVAGPRGKADLSNDKEAEMGLEGHY